MKKIVLTLAGFLIVGGLFAQNKDEGKVIYREVQKLEIKLEGDAAQFANSLPKERKSYKELLFSPSASIYQKNSDGDAAQDVAMEHGGAMVQIKMTEPDNKFYVDISKQKTIEQKEFMTRIFLIEGTPDASGWKITGEQKTILEYPCQKAVRTNEAGEETFAWFTPAIAVSSGPSSYIGLPGLVLEVTSDNGDRTIQATSIDFTAIDKDVLVKPKKGKKVSQEEYDAIVEEKMKEMGAQQGEGGGTFIMKIER
jgi:GLPGLI family protein